jgi:hypothetical protein
MASDAANRDERGLFRKGHKLGGRPRGLDLKVLVREKSEEAGLDFPGALFEVVRALIERAKGGDPQAAKLLFDKLCDDDTKTLIANGISVVVRSGVPQENDDV